MGAALLPHIAIWNTLKTFASLVFAEVVNAGNMF